MDPDEVLYHSPTLCVREPCVYTDRVPIVH